MKPKKKETCQDLVGKKYNGRLADLESAYHYFTIEKKPARAAHHYHEDLKEYQDFFDYVNQLGLCFEKIEAAPELEPISPYKSYDYFRWQLSWGGPADEFRIYLTGDEKIERVEYWYFDWFDAAHLKIEKLPGVLEETLEFLLEGSSNG